MQGRCLRSCKACDDTMARTSRRNRTRRAFFYVRLELEPWQQEPENGRQATGTCTSSFLVEKRWMEPDRTLLRRR